MSARRIVECTKILCLEYIAASDKKGFIAAAKKDLFAKLVDALSDVEYFRNVSFVIEDLPEMMFMEEMQKHCTASGRYIFEGDALPVEEVVKLVKDGYKILRLIAEVERWET